MTLPLSLDAVTPQWICSTLSAAQPGWKIEDARIRRVIPGTTTKVLVTVQCQREGGASESLDLCIKGGFDPALRPVFGSSYVAEARFYGEVAPAVDAPLPRCWYAAADPDVGQGIIIMDDLAAAGARFGDPSDTWPVERVAAALAVQARWQAPTWGASPSRFPALVVGSYIRQPAHMLFSQENWDRVFADESHMSRMPPALRDRRLVHGALERLWQHDDASGIPCLSHADPHVGNTFIDTDGQPGFLDWQSASLAPAMDDVAYFLVGAMAVEDRRRHERTLVEGYLDSLQSALGKSLDGDAYWRDYQRHCLHGLVWTVVPPELQPPGYRALMTERYVTAILDHESLSLLD